MNIAIIGNGQSALRVDWNKELKNKDLIVRLNYGTLNDLYSFNNIEHNACISGLKVLCTFSDLQRDKLLSSYNKVYLLSFTDEDENSLAFYSNSEIFKNNEKIIYKNIYNQQEFKHLLRKFNSPFYDCVEKTPFKENIFQPLNARRIFEKCVKSDLKGRQILIPSIGISSVALYSIMYPEANIFMYGFDFNRDTGWYWDKSHNHNLYANHDFSYEEVFIKKELSFFKNAHIIKT